MNLVTEEDAINAIEQETERLERRIWWSDFWVNWCIFSVGFCLATIFSTPGKYAIGLELFLVIPLPIALLLRNKVGNWKWVPRRKN